MNIYLVGFMGAGKSTVGKALAKILDYEFIDTDQVLEKDFGMAISEVFSKLGEKAFRDSESALLSRLSPKKGLVVATGGGMPERSQNLDFMRKSGKIVHLNIKLDEIKERLTEAEQKSRPLWKDETGLKNLFDKRFSIYGESDFSVSVKGKSPEKIAKEIESLL